jgi:hypothetical protein
MSLPLNVYQVRLEHKGCTITFEFNESPKVVEPRDLVDSALKRFQNIIVDTDGIKIEKIGETRYMEQKK